MKGKNKLGSYHFEEYADDNYWDVMKAQDLANLERLQQATKKMKQESRSEDKSSERARVHNKDYVKTAEGLAAQLANQTKASSKRRGYITPNWNTKDFRAWLSNNTSYNTLYENWMSASYVTLFKPTIQRIDTTKGFSLDNMKIVISKDKKYEK